LAKLEGAGGEEASTGGVVMFDRVSCIPLHPVAMPAATMAVRKPEAKRRKGVGCFMIFAPCSFIGAKD